MRFLSTMMLAAMLGGGGLAGCAQGGATGLGLNMVPDQEVRQAGLQAWEQIRAQTPESRDPAANQRVRAVSERILRAAGENPAAWEVVVFDSPQVNAFALPAGKIGVYTGMLRVADTDAQLAAVLGHEVGHNEAHHAAQRMNSEMATRAGVNVAEVALGMAGIGQPQLVAGLLGAGAEYGVLLPYSRNQELEADKLGLNYMAQAGYDPRQAVTLWQKMETQGGGQGPSWLSTHPAPGQRVEQLQALMPQALALYHGPG